MNKYVVIFTVVLCLHAISITATDLGTHGKTYSIVEPDALIEIQEQAKKVDWEKIINKKKLLNSAKTYKPVDIKKVNTAKRIKTYTVDLTYTLNYNITDGNGMIIYPAGYTFNPLDYINYNKTIVIINAAIPKQVEWLMSTKYAKDINTIILITDGYYYETSKRLKRPVYFANAPILNKFNITAVPAIVRQNGNMLQITEMPPEKNGNDNKKG